jgi:hypothetical protein
MGGFATETTLTTVGQRASLAMTGAAPVTTTGAKTIEIRGSRTREPRQPW